MACYNLVYCNRQQALLPFDTACSNVKTDSFSQGCSGSTLGVPLVGTQQYPNPSILPANSATSTASCQVTPDDVCQNFRNVAACLAARACCALAFTR